MDLTQYLPLVQQILANAVLALIGALLAAAVVGVKQVLRSVTANAGKNELALAQDVTSAAVRYAEQSGLKQKLVKGGEQKKKEAVDFAAKLLEKYNLKVTPDMLDKLIEQAVHSEFNAWK